MSADLEIVEIRPGILKRWVFPVCVFSASGVLFTAALSLFVHQGFRTRVIHFLIWVVLIPILYFKTKPIFGTSAVTVILTPEGLVDCSIPGKGLIPWEDIEAIGYVQEQWFGKTPALRLQSYEAFYASLTPKGYARVASTINARRRDCGFELFFPWILLDRPPSQFIQLLNSFWNRYGGKVTDSTEEAME